MTNAARRQTTIMSTNDDFFQMEEAMNESTEKSIQGFRKTSTLRTPLEASTAMKHKLDKAMSMVYNPNQNNIQ